MTVRLFCGNIQFDLIAENLRKNKKAASAKLPPGVRSSINIIELSTKSLLRRPALKSIGDFVEPKACSSPAQQSR